MEYTQILGFVFIALLLVVSPGPNGLLIAKTVPTSGKKAGFANIAGFVIAFTFHGSFSVLGLSVLLTSSAEAFFEGLLTNILNPKVSMFYLAAFPQFIPVGDYSVLYALSLVSLHALINTFWFSMMVILFAKLTSTAKNDRFQQVFKTVTGFIFIGFGAKLLVLENK